MFEPRRMRAGLLLAVFLAFSSPVPARGQEQAPPPVAEPLQALIPTSAFATRSAFGGTPVLSPDGQHIAFSLTEDDETWVGVLRVDDAVLERKIPLGRNEEPQWFGWAGNHQVMVSTARSAFIPAFGIEIRFGQVVAVETETGTVRQVAGLARKISSTSIRTACFSS